MPVCFRVLRPLSPANRKISSSNLKKVFRFVGILTLLSAAAMAQSISVSSPENGGSVGSPVHFVVSANGGGYPVSAIWIYVDNQPVYKAQSASIDAYT
ncbi:MAG: hypothetical protein ACRD3Q_15280, partial [Terriglobales bacterium]